MSSRYFVAVPDPAGRTIHLDPLHHVVVQPHADDHQSPPKTRVLLSSGVDAVVDLSAEEVVARLTAMYDGLDADRQAEWTTQVAQIVEALEALVNAVDDGRAA